MNQMKRWLVWLSRIHHCRGFGIQSPTDFAFVRYVVNEHWPYYAYNKLTDGDWLTQKLGRLYFRMANWRQPQEMLIDDWKVWWQAGCRRTRFVPTVDKVEMARIDIGDHEAWQTLLPRCNEQSVVIIEGINRDWQRWHSIERDECVGTTFDLYFCGIIFFDTKRFKHHYKINF